MAARGWGRDVGQRRAEGNRLQQGVAKGGKAEKE